MAKKKNNASKNIAEIKSSKEATKEATKKSLKVVKANAIKEQSKQSKKTSTTNSTKTKKDPKVNDKIKGTKGRSYRYSLDAIKVLDAVKKESELKLDDFVTAAVIEYGKTILAEKFPLEPTPTLESRLAFLEAVTDAALLDYILDWLEEREIPYKAALKKHPNLSWNEDITPLIDYARTKKSKILTEPEWRLLIKNKDKILKEIAEEA